MNTDEPDSASARELQGGCRNPPSPWNALKMSLFAGSVKGYDETPIKRYKYFQ